MGDVKIVAAGTYIYMYIYIDIYLRTVDVRA